MPTISPISELSMRYGKYLGKNEKETHLFKKVNDNGETVLTSFSNGIFYKRVAISPKVVDQLSNDIFLNSEEIIIFNYLTNIKTRLIREIILQGDRVIRKNGATTHDLVLDGKVVKDVLPEKFFEIEPVEKRTLVGVKKCNDKRIYGGGYLSVSKERITNPDGTFDVTKNVFADAFVMPNGMVRYADYSRTETYSAEGKLLNRKNNKASKVLTFRVDKSGKLIADFCKRSINIAKTLANAERAEKRDYQSMYNYI